MRNRRILTYVLAFLPLIITAIVLPMLPDQIPAHYGFNGNVTRFGSKYEMLILPIITIGMIFFWRKMEKISLKDKINGQQNAKVLFWGNIVMTLTFTILTIWFLYLSYTQAENINDSGLDGMKILSIGLSISWIILGIFLPKCRQNMIVGIRTKWTLASESVWHKTHWMGGRILIVTGIISSLLCLLVFDGMTGLFFSLGVLIVSTILITIYSRHVYKRQG